MAQDTNVQALRDAGIDVPDNLSPEELDFINGLTNAEIKVVIDIATRASQTFNVDPAVRRYPPVRICFPF